MPRKDKLKTEIEFELLEKIAEYYEFPVAVFFMPLKEWRKIRKKDGTRVKGLWKRIRKLEAIVKEE